MHILIIGAGGVGSAAARIAKRRNFFGSCLIADYDPARPEALVAELDDKRFSATQVDASNAAAVEALVRKHSITHVLNAVDPRFVMPIFTGVTNAGATYLDMAMSLSTPHPDTPHETPGVKLGDMQFEQHEELAARGVLALCGIGVEPGLSDVFARYAADELFSEIDELGVRDGANLTVEGYDFAPSFSIWTTIEECLNPPVKYEADRGWFTTAPFSEPEVFDFPEGIGPVECVNVEHEEVLLMPRWIDAKKVNFKYGLGEEFISVLKTLHMLGLDSTEPVNVKGQLVSPRDVVAAVLPDPAQLGDKMRGKTCAGVLVTGKDKAGAPKRVYIYHVADNKETMARDNSQAVVWQTALNPVIALELLATGVWSGAGVLGPEAFDAKPFLELLDAQAPVGYGSPWHIQERTHELDS
ncbi:saccharopine dehydrogenase C-terminal domain-containing protein [Paeniglutamicibacter psychrophenolicus]|uniref:Saccharopine dehydrogenase-like NADP-dependent oxidoreductase n=1 Tax=Paeniglutamicibacter psychrophenolicus TaxID=257454 RepID=A0ABS4WA77_9MICC|nr:saccharopine dehydrogenase C-terminal domain-containing protein [Paeniglutamicibacter psychrophenolicus]MBP2373093.1 saccharopine dehydrogenase-like NADP-dependent oxidoreductase [Paeniglutamicibacter psychrophenolicus]